MPISADELRKKLAQQRAAKQTPQKPPSKPQAPHDHVQTDRDDIVARNPLVQFLEGRGHKLFRSGESLVTSACPVEAHKKPGHRPVAIDVEKQVWYCNDHKVGGSVIDWEATEKKISIGAAMNALNGEKSSKPQIVCAYDYTDESGKLLSQTVRYKVPSPKKKDFKQRHPSPAGGWIWNLQGVRRVLYHLPQVIAAEQVIIVEGEKDADNLARLGFTATTNLGGAGKWRAEYAEFLHDKDVVVFGDIGDADRNGENHTQTILATLLGKVRSLKHPIQPDGFHDISDWIETMAADTAREAIQNLIEQTAETRTVAPADAQIVGTQRRAPLSIRTVDEILEMKFDPSDFILKNGYLTKGDLTAMCGMGGVGKSRLAMQLALCCRSGRDFLGWETEGRELRFLFLQTENSCRRLQSELEKMLSAFAPSEQTHLKNGLFFHTLEGDDDGFLMLDYENLERVQAAILDTRAAVVVFDPLRDFSLDDLNSDKVMGDTLRSILRVTKRGNPKRTPLAIHHAVSGRAGAQKAAGWDRSSFGRNSKVLQIIARSQINVAPAKGEDNSSIIIGSGKCNNAPEFEAFAAKLNFHTMLYAADQAVDMERWREEVSEPKGGRVDPKILREVLVAGKDYERPEIVEILKDEPVEVQKSRAYEIIREATSKKILKFSKVTKTYALVP
jgi:5S rRNA maturation endonuclease (ribonuclease M5)